MQKVLLATAVALSLSVVPLAASAASAGTFLRLEGARAAYDVDNTPYDGKAARAYGISGGYRWQLSGPFALGVEAAYVNLGTVKQRGSGSFFNANGTVQPVHMQSELGTRAFLIGANARWEVARKWSVTGRLGIAHTRTRLWGQMDAGGISNHYRDMLVRNTAYAGVGVGYALSPNLDLGFHVTHYSSSGTGFAVDENVNVNTFGVSAEVRF